MLWRVRGTAALTLVAVAAASCFTVPVRIRYETDGYLPTSTGDRLYRVTATEIRGLYLKPGVYFADYHRAVVESVVLSYGAPATPATVFDRKPGNYRLRMDAEDRIRNELRKALVKELHRDGGWLLMAEQQPIGATIVVSPRIVGFRWEAPPEQGSESLYVRHTGVMGLVLDIRDSQTGELLARLQDARRIKPMDVETQGAYESSPVNNWAGVRDVCRRWGWILRETLATLRGLEPLEDPEQGVSEGT
ncbi:MAG: DUF3313 family protein [Myxococcota bacterium]|nr:DUF3313 family protein [Myxococcota bacterium]